MQQNVATLTTVNVILISGVSDNLSLIQTMVILINHYYNKCKSNHLDICFNLIVPCVKIKIQWHFNCALAYNNTKQRDANDKFYCKSN